MTIHGCAAKLFRVLVFFGLFLAWISPMGAQTSSTGALAGTVTDSTGAVISSATVTVTSADTAQARTSTTGPDGSYRFGFLAPGIYRVRFEAAGFKSVEIPAATVNVTETAVLDRSLEVGIQTQQVTVETDVEAIQTTSSALGTVLNAQTVTDLPLNTRNFTNLLAMSAGVAANVSNATTIGKGATNMAVNGGSTGQNTYLMDGVAVNNWNSLGGVTEGTIPGSFAMPNPDAIAEFKIQTSSYDAGYGRNPGANVNVITKSGTNRFHGSAFEFFRNTVLNANDWFENAVGAPRPVLNSNVYGGAVGGPVKKDKLFFFTSYQENDQKNGYASYSLSSTVLPPIPTGDRGTCGPVGWTTIAGCDAAGAAFVTSLAANICSPTSTKPAPVQCPSAGPGDPAGLYNINPIAISILQLKLPGGSYFVPGSGTSGYASTVFSNPAGFKQHQGIGNVDYVINSKHTFSGRYIYETDPLNGNFPALNALEPGNAVPGNTIVTRKTSNDAIAKLTSILSNTMVNEFHVAYQRNVTNNSEAVIFHNSQVGITDFAAPGTSVVDNLSYMVVGNGGNSGQLDFGTHPFFGSHAIYNQYIVGDQISWTRGKQTFRTGFEGERVAGQTVAGTSSVGMPTFRSFSDFLIARAGSCGPAVAPTPQNPAGCNGLAASNISTQGGTTSVNSAVAVNPRVLLLNGFIQDDIKLTPRFTLNLGLRWELDQFPTERNGNFSTIWPSLILASPPPFVTAPGGPGESLAGYVVPSNYQGPIPTGVYHSNLPYYTRHSAPWDDFAPRVGFAWQPGFSDRLVVRGGAGYFYDVISGQYMGSPMGRSNPVFGPPALTSPAASLFDPWATPAGLVSIGPGYYGFQPRWVDVSTSTPPSPTGCTSPPCSSNITPTSWAQDLKVPVTYEWNLNTQYEFLPTWVLEVGYVGTHGIHQASPGAVNGPTADGSPINSYYNAAQLVGGPCVSCAATGVTTNTIQNVVLRVPLLGVSPGAAQLQTGSNYKYNSLQMTLRKQLSHGFQLQASYSWSRGFEQVQQGVNTYPYIVQAYAPEYFLRSQRLVVSYLWNLPLGHAQGFLGKVTDGWSLSGVTVIQNGQPIDIVNSDGGRIFGLGAGVSGNIGPAELCPGMTAKDILTSGSDSQRVGNGMKPNSDGWLNSAAFCPLPTIGPKGGAGTAFGNMAFGNVLGPGQSNWDMSLAKLIKIRETSSVQFRAEFFNTFNHPQFSMVNDNDVADAGGAGFGTISTTAVNPRVIQFALKFLF